MHHINSFQCSMFHSFEHPPSPPLLLPLPRRSRLCPHVPASQPKMQNVLSVFSHFLHALALSLSFVRSFLLCICFTQLFKSGPHRQMQTYNRHCSVHPCLMHTTTTSKQNIKCSCYLLFFLFL